ncbi:Large proline-rich protein bag6 [Hondaea fermentalgiana]|uniref:Large proline-rich protein bag6 n=1 Tax=Hondaea fermentalgiana TaxID=2315210 RepID=A0A2R5GLQ2_9STRA|nr:Large proline-rich protein bag6 [Hondaea fermentalgiana]|eukprot:GBG29211.1 Large proline-rich protein bag6 [Hondaea fermentalgiana]
METIWTIRVKTLNSETSSPVQLASTSSVPDLKSSIHEALGIATERQRLIFRGRVGIIIVDINRDTDKA